MDHGGTLLKNFGNVDEIRERDFYLFLIGK